MKERPILMSAPMVRATLDDIKTQTRRVMKPQPPETLSAIWKRFPNQEGCPYGKPGDRLWVKETWRPRGNHGPLDSSVGLWDLEVTYAADGAVRIIRDGEFGDSDWSMPKAAARGNVPSIFMPRWASRITLEIVSVRVERVQEISEDDAKAEGIERSPDGCGWKAYCGGGQVSKAPKDGGWGWGLGTAIHSYRTLWDSIYTKRGFGWYANPWGWVIEFRRIQEESK